LASGIQARVAGIAVDAGDAPLAEALEQEVCDRDGHCSSERLPAISSRLERAPRE
jgi:hypothetical protein